VRLLPTRPARGRTVLTGMASIGLLASLLLAGTAGVAAKDHPDSPPGSVDIQLLAINDFHGQLPEPAGSGGRIGATNAGGIVYLAADVRRLEAENPNTLFLSGGDLVGASPLVSAFYHDEPTVEAMNGLGMDFAVVGNHEFDEGLTELYRLQNGGCNPVDGCQTGHTYAGADFQYLAANVVGANGKLIFPAYKIRSFAGAKIGIIGIVTTETPTIVTPSAVAGLTFLPETETVNKYAAELKAKGVNTIVVLLHAGNSASAPTVADDPTATVNGCPTTLTPSFASMVAGMDGAVRVVISGHSHNFYNCMIGNKIVTGASSAGRVLTDVDITIDRSSDSVTKGSASNMVVTRDVTPDPAAAALLGYYNTLSAPLRNQVVGSITADITRTLSPAGESALGDVLADGQLAASSSAVTGNAVVAMTNPGGIRTDLTFGQISGGELPGQVTYEEAFAVQPFYNILTTLTMTGEQIKTVLEQQLGPETSSPKMLQISGSLTYTWTSSAPSGSHVSNMQINAAPVNLTTSYRVTVNNFLAGGGDGFTGFVAGTNPFVGGADIDAMVAYLKANSPLAPGPQNRITRVQ
jgi:5'-nucleotidase